MCIVKSQQAGQDAGRPYPRILRHHRIGEAALVGRRPRRPLSQGWKVARGTSIARPIWTQAASVPKSDSPRRSRLAV